MANIIEMQLKSSANRVNVQKINVTNEVITSKYRHLNFGQNVLFDVIFKFQTSMHQFSIFLFFFFLSVSGACTLFETWYQHISTRCRLSPSAGSFQGLLLCSAYKELIVTRLLIAVSWLNVLFFFKSWYLVSVKVPILQLPFIYCSLQSTTPSLFECYSTPSLCHVAGVACCN